MSHTFLRSILTSIVVFTCILLVICLPVDDRVKDPLYDFETTRISRLRQDIRNGDAVYGIAPTTDRNGCKAFACPIDYCAVRVPITADSIKTRLNRQNIYCVCVPKQDASLLDLVLRAADLDTLMGVIGKTRHRRTEQSVPEFDPNTTFVPPPKVDITPDLIAESLRIQPQDTATIGSIMPHFQHGVISYGIQLNGLVAATITLNASTSLPCANIGGLGQTQPDLVLRPKDIVNGTAQPYVPDCNVIAVNMYNPNVINYWVMNAAGAIYSLVGSNKLMQINQLNSTESTSLVLRAQPPSIVKRDVDVAAARDGEEIVERAMSEPDRHTATMTAGACAAMICNNNGGKPAVFNPFTTTCWCKDPVYAEIEQV